MTTEELERLKRVEEKLDWVIAKIDQAEKTFGLFMLGPGKKLARLLGLGQGG